MVDIRKRLTLEFSLKRLIRRSRSVAEVDPSKPINTNNCTNRHKNKYFNNPKKKYSMKSNSNNNFTILEPINTNKILHR